MPFGRAHVGPVYEEFRPLCNATTNLYKMWFLFSHTLRANQGTRSSSRTCGWRKTTWTIRAFSASSLFVHISKTGSDATLALALIYVALQQGSSVLVSVQRSGSAVVPLVIDLCANHDASVPELDRTVRNYRLICVRCGFSTWTCLRTRRTSSGRSVPLSVENRLLDFKDSANETGEEQRKRITRGPPSGRVLQNNLRESLVFTKELAASCLKYWSA